MLLLEKLGLTPCKDVTIGSKARRPRPAATAALTFNFICWSPGINEFILIS